MWQLEENWNISLLISISRVLLAQRVFPHQVRDVFLELGNINEHLVVDRHLQPQVVAWWINLMGLEEKEKIKTCSFILPVISSQAVFSKQLVTTTYCHFHHPGTKSCWQICPRLDNGGRNQHIHTVCLYIYIHLHVCHTQGSWITRSSSLWQVDGLYACMHRGAHAHTSFSSTHMCFNRLLEWNVYVSLGIIITAHLGPRAIRRTSGWIRDTFDRTGWDSNTQLWHHWNHIEYIMLTFQGRFQVLYSRLT